MGLNAVHKIEKYSCFSRMIKLVCQPKYVLLRKIKATTNSNKLVTCSDCKSKMKETTK